MPPVENRVCCCCGATGEKVFHGFNKAKFNYTVAGLWPHPHSPRICSLKKGGREEKFVSFTTTAPAWTQLSRFVVQKETGGGKVEGQEPAAVVRQAQCLVRSLRLTVGGYRNNQASILERRHELIFLNDGWSGHAGVVNDLVSQAIGYRDALNGAMNVFVKGIKKSKIKGTGIDIKKVAEEQFYRSSEDTVLDTLARIDFANAAPQLLAMGEKLHRIAEGLFNESVRPYLSDPELVRTMAVSRKTLHKHLRALKPQNVKGGVNGTHR